MQATKQSGFGVVAIVIAILVVVGLGYIGYRVYTANNNQTGNTAQNSNAQNNGTQDTATYLDIKELGVKIKLSDGIKDAVYAPFDVPATDGSQVYGISAQSLIDKETGDNCSAAHGALGLIRATTIAPTYVGGQQTLPVDNKTLFKFGDTYYQYVRPQAYGCAQDQITSDMVSSKVDAFAQAFTTVQLDN